MAEIQDLTPQDAKEWYVDSRETELSESTIRAHRYRLTPFVEFCDENGIEYLSDLTGHHFDQYKIWRRENGDLNNVTLNTQLSTLRVFIKWAEKIEAVPRDFHEYITPPSIAHGEDVSSAILRDEEAADIHRYYQQYKYATRNHTLMELLWHTGMRSGSIRDIDLGDIDDNNNKAIYVRHRPQQGTPLKKRDRRRACCGLEG